MHIVGSEHFAPLVEPGVVSQQTCGGLHTAAPHGTDPPCTTPPSPPLLLLPPLLLAPLLLVLLPPDDVPLPLLPVVPDEPPLVLPELPPELPVVEPDEPPLPELLPPPSPDRPVDDEPPHAIATATPNPIDAVERILAIRMKAISLCCPVGTRRPHSFAGVRLRLSTISNDSSRTQEGKPFALALANP
jgi:hypothetical protein